ncbi:unnamed protein product [Peniophora sp. CBMAI 1063]|nr:unnamed protein product [Peniophora sp. CBMAI 1063]
MSDNFIEIRVLGGEQCYLGQLYDTRTSALLPGHALYKNSDIRPRQTSAKSTKIHLVAINSFSDRASSLNISAQLSLAVLAGLINANGSGSFLTSHDDTDESVTIALISRYRSHTESLDFNDLENRMSMSAHGLASIGATHVVTSITYGGDVIGTMTQRSAHTTDATVVRGGYDLSLRTMKNMGKALGVGSNGGLTGDEKALLDGYDLKVDLAADFRLEDDQIPTDPASMLELLRKSSSLVGDGVPCEVRLTPLSKLLSGVPSIRELAEADLLDIRHAFDNFLKLEHSRARMYDAVQAHQEFFPSFTSLVATRSIEVTKLVQRARDRLRAYLQTHRSARVTDAPKDHVTAGEFVASIRTGFTAAASDHEKDKALWRKCQDILAVAKRHEFPIVNISSISGKMSRVNQTALVAILVPENPHWETLITLYSDIAVDIRQWRRSIDISEGVSTEYMTIYADPYRDTMLHSLDDKAATLMSALQAARNSKQAVLLSYGRSSAPVGGYSWRLLNEDGWGVVVNKVEAWRYVGEVARSKPHGSGVITYVNKKKYIGSFVHGQCDGEGKVVDEGGIDVPGMNGVFMANVLKPHGVMVEVTVMSKNGIPVQHRRVALNRWDSVRAHAARLATVLDWDGSRRLRIVVDDGAAQVDVLGGMIDPDESPAVESSCWQLGDLSRIVAHIR